MRLKFFTNPVLVNFVLLTFVISILSPPIIGQEKAGKKLHVAVLEFEARSGVTKAEAASLSDAFQGAIIETKQFIVVDRNRIKTILEEQGFQQTEACSDVECLVEVGKILKVEKMFAGTIGKVGKIYLVNVQLIDVETAQIIQNKSRRHSGDIEDLLTDIIPELAEEMIKELTGESVEVTKGGGGSSWKWLWYVGGAAVVGGATAFVISKVKKGEKEEPKMLPGAPSMPPY